MESARDAEAGGVIENPASNRFEMRFDGGMAFATFRRQDGYLVISYTAVPREFNGRGIGSRLVEGIYQLARKRGEKVVPACPFVADWAHRHPEYADVMADGR